MRAVVARAQVAPSIHAALTKGAQISVCGDAISSRLPMRDVLNACAQATAVNSSVVTTDSGEDLAELQSVRNIRRSELTRACRCRCRVAEGGMTTAGAFAVPEQTRDGLQPLHPLVPRAHLVPYLIEHFRDTASLLPSHLGGDLTALLSLRATVQAHWACGRFRALITNIPC